MAINGRNAVVLGVSPDAPTTTNARGGRQSDSPYRCDLFPPLALLAVAKVLRHGADKYGANNWHAIPVNDHINHALVHLYALLAGDLTDEHLEHAACRIVMALDQKLSGRDETPADPPPVAENLEATPPTCGRCNVRLTYPESVAAGRCNWCRSGTPWSAAQKASHMMLGGTLPTLEKPRRKRVYIAGPISKGDLAANVNAASRAFEQLARAGLAPWCPHWSVFSGGAHTLGASEGNRVYTHDPTNPDADADGEIQVYANVWAPAAVNGNGMSHADWLAVDLTWVGCADALLRLPGDSDGADAEVDEAEARGIPVFHSIDDLFNWAFPSPVS